MTREAIEAAIYDAPLGIPPKFKQRDTSEFMPDRSDDWKGERLIRIATGYGKKDDKNGRARIEPERRPQFTDEELAKPATMTVAEFRQAVEDLGTNFTAVGRGIGVSGRTVRRWAVGDKPVPGVAARYVRRLLAEKSS